MRNFLIYFCLLILISTSCKRIPVDNINDNSLKPLDAKEWYYDVFKKSSEWQLSSLKGKKLPDWKHGVYRKSGNLEILEFPLMKEKKTFSIASSSNNDITKRERIEIANGSLSRIAIIRISGKETLIRELDYIPDLNFLTSKKFDISDISLGNRINKFSGKIIVKKWQGTEIGSYRLENGRITKKSRRIANSAATSGLMKSAQSGGGCEIFDVCEYMRYCTGGVGGDEWYNTDECTEWEPTGNCYMEEECEMPGDDDPHGPSDCELYGVDCGDNGGGGTPPIVTQEPDTPCAQADSLAKNGAFKARFNSLKDLVHEKKEYAYVYKNKITGGMDATPIEGNANEKFINFSIQDKIDGLLHSHFDNSLSVFSASDLYAMADLYILNRMVDPSTFTLGVVTANGTQYLLKIDDMLKFSQFAGNLVNNSTLEQYEYVYENLFGIKPKRSNANNEKDFLYYLQTTNSGLKLFKGNSTFDSWQPKKVNASGTVVNNPC